jgi:hypothetical protein
MSLAVLYQISFKQNEQVEAERVHVPRFSTGFRILLVQNLHQSEHCATVLADSDLVAVLTHIT